ncbi:hypothetical protein Dshi_1312 [Dinoroseobacter shibae DFL 12 = DSM 16493]|jgi:Na+/melibiose symporter-like transporter|uniref:Uncharacterized protein n=1 Tax=Dinoroseobacter shibae (strain DSM 16493 / NCIMB 14021 / DFL 12) TaxID=398580 RepID=A8LIU0_DINSH|nr:MULTISPECIES: hypothetical protein [Dinoroseobacter]ABV93054.1 hypothetical protein Dshi_1312 [Dinoroseobacter shibae DFL 12 = DSM 16493]MDD9716155.1 hypothetical protein [Dinoroseobacter sp. PD6]URF47985.1 hypothetical protein M8008_06775 [Dinoroseobacter shibae]URF52294.1 hypothetical protein M8007_06775 [Dinoroseobacter shibae]
MSMMVAQVVLGVSLIGICVGLVVGVMGALNHQRGRLVLGGALTVIGTIALFVAMGSFGSAAV